MGICKTCSKPIRGTSKSNSNFLAHLKKFHSEKYNEYQRLIIKKKDNKNAFAQKVLFFIADTMSSVSIVEKQSFKNLFKNEKLPCRNTMTNLIEKEFLQYIAAAKDVIKKSKYICTTADIWSGGKKSFFGYTAHIINEESMQKESFILSCKRFFSPHSFNRIAEIISEINSRFEIRSDQVVATVTDNASNFVKAFKEFGISEDDDFEDIAIDNDDFKLSKHIRCASHTLNLIATSDYISILKKENLIDNHLKVNKKNLGLCMH